LKSDQSSILITDFIRLLTVPGPRGEIPRRYWHAAEPFVWSLISLCLATVGGKDGKGYTRDLHPLLKWFQDQESSRHAERGLNGVSTIIPTFLWST